MPIQQLELLRFKSELWILEIKQLGFLREKSELFNWQTNNLYFRVINPSCLIDKLTLGFLRYKSELCILEIKGIDILLALKMYFTLFFQFVDIAFQTKYDLHGCN